MFYITVHRFRDRVQSSTSTAYEKCLVESIMAVLTPKSGIIAAIHSFNATVHFSNAKNFSHQIFANLLSACFRTPVTVKQTFHRSNYFQSNINYIEMRAVTWSSYFSPKGFVSEHVVVWSICFFLITISW